MTRLSTVKPTQKVLDMVSNGRSVIGPDSRARMWRAYRLPVYACIEGSRAWEVMLQDASGTNVGVVWQYTIPSNGAPMLWQRETDYA